MPSGISITVPILSRKETLKSIANTYADGDRVTIHIGDVTAEVESKYNATLICHWDQWEIGLSVLEAYSKVFPEKVVRLHLYGEPPILSSDSIREIISKGVYFSEDTVFCPPRHSSWLSSSSSSSSSSSVTSVTIKKTKPPPLIHSFSDPSFEKKYLSPKVAMLRWQAEKMKRFAKELLEQSK